MIDKDDGRLNDIVINQIYIDEVQDLTMSQIYTLVKICSDPQNGLMFAGDTAQVRLFIIPFKFFY